MRVTNGIPLGWPFFLPVHTVICVQTLKVKLLTTLPTSSAIAVYEREMVARSSKRVLASREAADSLHSASVLDPTTFSIAGVAEVLQPALQTELINKKVGAWCGGDTDALVAECIAAVTNP
jgi:hypothetical protein